MGTLGQSQNRQYWSIRVFYFLFLGAFSFLTPFLTLFYRRQGLSGTQIGLLGTVGAIIGVVVAPQWGRWSDRLVHPRRLLQFAFMGSAVCYLVLSRQDVYVWMAFLVGLNAVLLSGIEPISDTMALKSGEGGERTRFGSIRLWGSLGWASVVYFAGVMIEKYGIRSAFWGYAGFVLLTIIALNYTRPTGDKRRESRPIQAISYRDLVMELVRDPALVGLGLSLSLLWFVRVGLYQFQAIYMVDLGAGESLIGLVNTIAAVVELPSMLWADHLVNRYGSHRVMKMALLVFVLHAGSIVIHPQIPMFLVSGAFSGLAFSLFNVSLVVFVDERAPLGQTATVLALFTSTLRGLIQILASPLSGLAYDAFGAYWLYVIATAGSLLGWFALNLFVSGKRSQMGQLKS
jgi:PPP family 3-phenylpropionic acid transporter